MKGLFFLYGPLLTGMYKLYAKIRVLKSENIEKGELENECS